MYEFAVLESDGASALTCQCIVNVGHQQTARTVSYGTVRVKDTVEVLFCGRLSITDLLDY